MTNFLPDNYEVPQKVTPFMKFELGENRFRILASPILGYVWWVIEADGSRKPMRVQMDVTAPASVKSDEIKHFWAFPVFNYKLEKIQILEITQKVIQKAIKNLVDDPDWGNPMEFDLVVTKIGQKLDTEYQINPKPAKKLDPGIKQLFEDMEIDLTALYRGGDPFQASEQVPF